MANLIQVGQPANDAEKWAFHFLKENLPDHYVIIANVDVYSDHGQPFECDAIVVGDWAVYVIDVKGYQGRLSAGKDVWKHENRSVENPLPKLHQNARILASRCRFKLRQNQHAPWCQGLAFITGGVGGEVEIFKGQDSLPVYHRDNVIRALTNSSYVTSYHKYQLNEPQKQIALSAICDFNLLKEKEQTVGSYSKKQKLSETENIELWLVEPEGHTFNFQYWMKFVDISGMEAARIVDLRAQFKKEFYILSELTDLPTVPAVLSYHDDGESLALVHQNIYGQPLSELEVFDKKEVMLAVASSLYEMDLRGIRHRTLSLDNIYLSEDGKVQLLNVGHSLASGTNTLVPGAQLDNPWLPPEYINKGVYDSRSLSYQFAHVFLPEIVNNPPRSHCTLEYSEENYTLIKSDIDAPLVDAFEWLADASDINQDIRPDLSEFIDCFDNHQDEIVEGDFQLIAGANVNGKYELIDCIGRGSTSSIWRATHLLGEYVCCLKVFDTFDGSDHLAQKEFDILRGLYHPNIVRIFDLDVIAHSDQYFLTCEYLNGETLSQYELSANEECLEYFKQILSALQYLHRFGRIHKDVKPENIVIANGKANLIDFNLSMLDSRLIGTTRYKDPVVKANGWNKFSDIYSLVLSFSEVLSFRHPFSENDDIPSVEHTPYLMKSNTSFLAPIRSKFDQVLRHDVDWNGIQDYSSWFGLTDKVAIEIPASITIKWKVNKGYMLKVLKYMLADMQPRSRKVVVRNTLKLNDIVGNSASKGSVNSAISALKSTGIIEEHGAKIKLTDIFLKDWFACQKQ